MTAPITADDLRAMDAESLAAWIETHIAGRTIDWFGRQVAVVSARVGASGRVHLYTADPEWLPVIEANAAAAANTASFAKQRQMGGGRLIPVRGYTLDTAPYRAASDARAGSLARLAAVVQLADAKKAKRKGGQPNTEQTADGPLHSEAT